MHKEGCCHVTFQELEHKPEKPLQHLSEPLPVMKKKLITCAALSATLSSGLAANPPVLKAVESQRRMDPTGAGSFHRTGMIREAQNTLRHAEKLRRAEAAKKTTETKR